MRTEMNPYLTFEKREDGALKATLTEAGEQKLVQLMLEHGRPADRQALEEKGYSTDEHPIANIEDVWDDFFMFFLLVSPSIEVNKFTWGDAAELAMHGSFLLWEGEHDLDRENVENTAVWYYNEYAIRSIVHDLLQNGYVILSVAEPPDAETEND